MMYNMEKVKHYMLRDLVMLDDDVCIVKTAYSDGEYSLIDMDGFYHTSWLAEIKPITLTSKILEANGWKIEPSENVTWYKYRTDKANLYICKDSFTNKDWLVCVGLDKLHIANIKYVHQLQHLLFGLGLPMDLKV